LQVAKESFLFTNMQPAKAPSQTSSCAPFSNYYCNAALFSAMVEHYTLYIEKQRGANFLLQLNKYLFFNHENRFRVTS